MPITTVKAISQTFKKFKTIMNQPGKGHKAILSAATVGEISKDHSFRITEFGSILGSLCLQIHHKTSPPCQQTVWKVCQKEAFPIFSSQAKAQKTK